MTITQLESFIKIVQTGSFTSAASDLGYAQSTVTTQIRQLEEELGTDLFDRLGKTVVITSAGERLLIHAEKIMQLEREIRIVVPESPEPSGILRLGVSESLCYNRLPGILMDYKRSFPKVDIRLQFIMHDTFPALLKSGELDLAYTLNPEIQDDTLRLLYSRPETLGFYCSPGHSAARKKSIKETDLDGVQLLLTSHECNFRHMLLRCLEERGVTADIMLETSSKEILKQFAINGLGVAFMPDMTAEAEAADGSLIRLNWKGKALPVFSQVFVHKDKYLNNAVKELVEMIEKAN
ncbi:MAG: LysR family transcriptional regulator [Lachnospiraceae bacterium]|nr:LysR family transcriptional regulator [Lachnospiraceae bacterium]